jgi:transcriptional regulator with XRE-family HTH domain
MKIFAERLHELRTEKGLSTRQLAGLLEVSSAIISLWENNACRVTDENLVRVAKFFGVSADYLLGLEN